jgi:putative ABC transport system ATP-binding protein
MTLVMVTHDPHLKNMAHRCIWMRDGKISKEERIEESLRLKTLKELELKKEEKKLKKIVDHVTEVRQPHDYPVLVSSLPSFVYKK